MKNYHVFLLVLFVACLIGHRFGWEIGATVFAIGFGCLLYKMS